MSSAQFVKGTRAGAPHDAAVQHCPEYLGSYHPEFELEEGAPSVLQFVDVRLKAAPCVAYVVDVPPEVYELIYLILHLTGYPCADYGGGFGHPLRA